MKSTHCFSLVLREVDHSTMIIILVGILLQTDTCKTSWEICLLLGCSSKFEV